MKNQTQKQILEYIRSKKGARPGEIIVKFGKYPTGVFRHLRALLKKGDIYKIGNMPKVIYYASMNKTDSQLYNKATNWAVSGGDKFLSPDNFCQTRDVFLARSERRLFDILKTEIKNENTLSLLVAIIGEIGNNAFDHNLGNWRDVPGVLFELSLNNHEVVIVDRGQGVRATLKKVRSGIQSHADALRVAFTETVSGRAPESRGNGLKLVKKVVEENNMRLEFLSGDAKVEINESGMSEKKSDVKIPGTLAYIKF